ncbi:MAG: nitroreductase [Holophagaceae bacterium]|nr:nitroreductase [Holophagaceae bacterium]
MSHPTQELLEALHWRYATKVFDRTRPLADADWDTLKEALTLSASSYGMQPYRFVIPRDPELRKQLREASRGQAQVTDASHLVVFAARDEINAGDVDHFLASLAKTRGVPLEKLEGFRSTLTGDLVEGPRAAIAGHWAARQAYLALGNLLASAALLHIDACPMEGFSPARYDAILGLRGTGYHTVCICALGYRAPEDAYAQAPKFRFPAEELFVIK